ncbi:uncharacterized protein F54H12.2-like [Haliotis rubra]|uniref:uncharacterized protein F54H12.2-like n=1 Tax=Haliotis rubra TaxID=36100 RepID=UPI001EE5B0CA|nr:uncharacterized protein F54H12.2-like [Haliotis rubra]
MFYFNDVRPLSQINDSSPLEFAIPNQGSEYIDLKRTRLHVKLKVVHDDVTSSPLAEDEKVGPINLFLQSLFSQVSVSLGNQLVSSANNHYPYKSMLKTLLNYGADAKSSQLTSQLFYKDTGNDNDDIESTDAVAGGNDGLLKRGDYIAKSQEITMVGNLFEDVFNMDRYLINGVKLNVTLYRTDPQFCLMSGVANTKYKISILDASLKVCYLKVNPALILAHNTLFEEKTNGKPNNALYPYVKTEVKSTTIPVSTESFTIENISNPVAHRYTVAFVESSSMTGSLVKNPYNFKLSMIKKVTLNVNGVSLPGRSSSADDADTYLNLFDGVNVKRESKGNFISRKEFLLGSALFVFELNETGTEHLSLVRRGNVSLEIQFNAALTKSLSCIVMTERTSRIEIDQARNVYVK